MNMYLKYGLIITEKELVMKKTLSMLAVLGVVAVGIQSAQAFSWSSLNPAYWGHCPKCEKKKSDCDCQKKCDPCEKIQKYDPCETGAAAPCDPCAKKAEPCNPCQKVKKCDPCEKKVQPCDPCQKVQKQPCDPCNKLQNMTK